MSEDEKKEALWQACKKFIEDMKISCKEATVEDRVYINAPYLVEDICDIVGYYEYEN